MLAVGVYLQTLRKAHGFSRAEVAHQVGTHESQIVRIEAGRHAPRTTDLDNILDYLANRISTWIAH